MEQLFNKGVLEMTVEQLIVGVNKLLNEHAPAGKTVDDFTGGYIQQLKNSTRLTAFFGTKTGSNNKATSQIDIEPEDIDLMYLMLKAKIHEMRNSKAVVKKVSISAMIASSNQPKGGW